MSLFQSPAYMSSEKFMRALTFKIRLDARNITMRNIRISEPEFDGRAYPEVYQLCVCGKNGKLFLSPSRGNCQATQTVCN